MGKIAIYGAGGFGREIRILIDQINKIEEKFEFVGFFDDGIAKGTIIDDNLILGGIEELNQYGEINVVLGIGNPQVKRKIIHKITNKQVKYPNLIHPNVVLYDYNVHFGRGIVICPGVFLSLNIELSDFVSINVCCTVGHDAKIGSFSSLMPNSSVSGNVLIGENVFVGVGAKTNNDIRITNDVVVGAGAVVLKSIDSACIVFGNPARIMVLK